ncbi:signal transducer and activator of transcription C-like [Anopheles aquasalis]|uniref:signal transducer and activator of transcription C-like n=1 Tax=Anopheles aquasalis TaxID=42839 RepID=UPI00215B15FF|nr:signal transducer and activator of transcription C-like [Anopheles aquasalis]
MSPQNCRSFGGHRVVAVLMLVVLLTLEGGHCFGRRFHEEGKVKRESDTVDEQQTQTDPGSGDEIIYDQRQVSRPGGTNIRLNIKNLQVQLPESQLERFQATDMIQLIQQSVLRLLGIPIAAEPAQTQQQAASTTRPSLEDDGGDEQGQEKQESASASMLQVNGNNVPAKFFLEISDFLMNTKDNDAVDDQRVDDNHNEHQRQEELLHQQQQHELQQLQQQQHHQQFPHDPSSLYATEEIKIERLENSNNVKNETITISKRLTNLVTAAPNVPLIERNVTEHRTASNATQNATASEDRHVQTKPIRLDTVLVRMETSQQQGPRKTLREKVIWRMPLSAGDVASYENPPASYEQQQQ